MHQRNRGLLDDLLSMLTGAVIGIMLFVMATSNHGSDDLNQPTHSEVRR